MSKIRIKSNIGVFDRDSAAICNSHNDTPLVVKVDNAFLHGSTTKSTFYKIKVINNEQIELSATANCPAFF